jgi:hypothetical protein
LESLWLLERELDPVLAKESVSVGAAELESALGQGSALGEAESALGEVESDSASG